MANRSGAVKNVGTVMRIGVDFGSTRTVVAAAVRGRYPVVVFETSGGFSDYVPGIAVQHGDALHFGWEAMASLREAPSHAVRSIKRAVSRHLPDDSLAPLLSRTALELTTEYLKRLRELIVESSNVDVSGDEPLEAMIAVPANAATPQRYLTLEAFRRAGFRVLGLINEPTAAAIEFAHHNLGAIGRRSPKRYVVVYDLGGGTFDTSAVSLAERRFELITSEGIAELGGDDFDAVILQLALEKAGLREHELDAAQRVELLETCRIAKETLTAATRKLLIDFEEQLPDVKTLTLDVHDIYDACRPLVARTLELVQRVFASLETRGIDPHNPRELGAVYLVGGSTAFPAVSRELRELYKRKIQLAPQPQAATAIGLAIAADPDAGLFIREATTRHVGVWREASAGREKVFDPILSKGEFPAADAITIERSYHPAHAVGHLRFLECTDLNQRGEPCGDLTPWGDVLFPYDPALRDTPDLADAATSRRPELGSQEIVEVYRYAQDGTVSLAIQNRTSGYERRFVLGHD